MTPLANKQRTQTARGALSRVVLSSLAAGIAMLATIPALSGLIARGAGTSTAAWLVALPGILLAVAAVVAMRSLRRMGELEQRMHADAMAFGFRSSVLLAAIYTYTKAAGLSPPPVEWLLPTMVSCWVIGLLLAVKRYH